MLVAFKCNDSNFTNVLSEKPDPLLRTLFCKAKTPPQDCDCCVAVQLITAKLPQSQRPHILLFDAPIIKKKKTRSDCKMLRSSEKKNENNDGLTAEHS